MYGEGGGSRAVDPSTVSKGKIIVFYENQINYDSGVISQYKNIRE